MSKRRLLAREAPDYGPELRLQRGEVERHYRPDPDAPHRTVHGARRVSHYDQAWRRGCITDAEHEAADRYLTLSERAAGASQRRMADGASTAAWRRAVPEAVLQAVMELRRADEALGPAAAELLRAYVAMNMPVEAIASRRGENRHLTMGRVRAALQRLVEHWRIEA